VAARLAAAAAAAQAEVVALSHSLAARVASRAPHKETRLPDGRVVWAVPAFTHHYVFCNGVGGGGGGPPRGKFAGFVFAHPRLAELLSVRSALLSEVVPSPMVVPPVPWTSFNGPGPYYVSRFPLMRTVAAHREVVVGALKAGAAAARGGGGGGAAAPLGAVLTALDFLSSTPWAVNSEQLRVARALWNDAGDPEGRGGRARVPGHPTVPDVPPFESEDAPLPPPPPPPPAAGEAAPSAEAARAEALARGRRLAEAARVAQARADAHSLRSDFRLKLEVAKEHVRDGAIYFPHNMDFRGRVYPLPPHLNHMGNDMSRGLLLFARAAPLGGDGLYWLKVHLANLMGRDKLPFAGRVEFVDAHVAQVLAVADAPLRGGCEKAAWWTTTDKPWQALSACRELAAVLRLPAHARPLYECRLPVHMDGSCNGIQHYAALGRDPEGAAAVNLAPGAPGEGPADVYSRVLDVVLARLAADAAAPCAPASVAAARAENSSIFAQRRAERLYEDAELAAASAPLRKLAATFLAGRVDRKVVKQTVMTSVYGVTFLGAKDQVWNRLRERFPPAAAGPGGVVASREDLDFMLRLASAYLARVTLNSLGTLFSRADAIKTWLAEAARAVAARDQPIAWVTPLGLPCVQPYRENEKRTVVTVLQNVVVRETGDPDKPVCRFRQRSAFPPNFIHSLDSTHMFKTALACQREGITFAAVHDSFWTHPASVGRMRRILRSEFVDLYEEPVLERFRESLVDRFPGMDLPPLPPKGSFDLREVLAAEYFFS